MLERMLHPRANPIVRHWILAALAVAASLAIACLALQWNAIRLDRLLIACLAVPIAIGCFDLACALAATALSASLYAASWAGPGRYAAHDLLAIASVVLLPVCLATRDGGSGERRLRAVSQATGLSGLAQQLALAACLPIWDWRSQAAWCGCLLVAAMIVPTAAVLAAQRPLAGSGPAQPLPLPPLPPLPMPNARALCGWLLWALVALVLVGVVRSPDFPRYFPPPLLAAIALQGAVWVLATGVWRFLLLPLLSAAACVSASVHRDTVSLFSLLIVVQAPALAWWWRRAVGSTVPWYPLPLWCLALLIAVIRPTDLLVPAATMLVLVALVELGLARFPREVRTPRQALAAARGRLAPFWHWYLRLKWRLDPVFAVLARDQRPWGEVLDLGCGPGITAAIAQLRHGTTGYCGIDLDLEKLEVARTVLAAMDRRLDATWRLFRGQMPFPQSLPARFDTVLLVDVLHYWPPGAQDALLRWARTGARADTQLMLRDGACDAQGGAGAVEQGERFTTAIGLNPRVAQLHFRTHDDLAHALEQSG
jgi:SAM-dependent methyltransferase